MRSLHQHNIPAGAFNVDFIASGFDDTEDASPHITFYEWCRNDDKIKKQLYHLNVEDFLKKFQETIEVATRRVDVKQVQVNCYNDINKNLKENDVILDLDYSKNYEYKHQNEI